MIKTWHLLALLALLLSGCSSPGGAVQPTDSYQTLASGVCPPVQESFFIPDWQIILILAIGASASILALLYVFHHLVNNDAGKATVKLEIFELFTTVFIALVVIAILNASCIIPVGSVLLFPQASNLDPAILNLNAFDAAAFILEEFSTNLATAATVLHWIYIPFDFTTSMTLTQRPLGMGTEYQPTAGLGAVMKPVFINSLQMISVGFIMVRAQLLMLDFVTFAMLKYYLPLGILMRAFAPTRRIGGTLIGLTLGLVLIYPYLIIMNGITIFSMNPFMIDQYMGQIGTMVSAAWDPFNDFQTQSLSLSGVVLDGLSMVKIIVSSAIGTIVGLYMSLILRTAAIAFLIGIFFPALNTLILVTTIRYLTKSFGEEIDVSNLTRMI
ncbi:MAG: hypothetical protein GY852_04295 [bacterium]|nr:hypothetical protein [bacterium]